jgi:integrase
VPQNAASKTDRPKVRPPEIHPLDAEQTKALLSTARGERLEALYVVAVTAGLRIGELLGLSWEDLDLEAGTMRVVRGRALPRSAAYVRHPAALSRRAPEVCARAVGALFPSHDPGPLLSLDTLDGRPDGACNGGCPKLRRNAFLIALLPRCCQRDPYSVPGPYFLACLKRILSAGGTGVYYSI